jgi:SAM-dependent methyltransferase
MAFPRDLYLTDEYLTKNPTWDAQDSPWKAAWVAQLLAVAGIEPASICEVGCGAGGVLAELRRTYPKAKLTGFDIAPAASTFWPRWRDRDIEFQLGDFLASNDQHYDVVLALDVVEHVHDPFDFLARLQHAGSHFVFHFPLDLSALNVFLETPLLRQRHTVGHIHYFTKSLALALLRDTGYQVLDVRYSDAAWLGPSRGWKQKLAALPRRILQSIHKELGVRLLGGQTLFVVAKAEGPTSPQLPTRS